MTSTRISASIDSEHCANGISGYDVNGQVRLGVCSAIISVWVRFWIRLTAVCYRDKRGRAVGAPAVRLVNKSRDTHKKCIRKKPQYVICVVLPLVYITKPCKLILWDLTRQITCNYIRIGGGHCDRTGGRFKNTYELLNLRALKFSYVNRIHICQCMGEIFCVEFQRYPLKFHTKHLTHTLKDMIFMQFWNFGSS